MIFLLKKIVRINIISLISKSLLSRFLSINDGLKGEEDDIDK
jgi:hypothetical protein